MKTGDIICRDLHALQPTDIQAFIDRLSIVERHRVCRILNYGDNFGNSPFARRILQHTNNHYAYDIEYLEHIAQQAGVSTGAAGRKDN